MKKLIGTAMVLLLFSGAFSMDLKIFGGVAAAWYKKPQEMIANPEISISYLIKHRLLMGLGFESPISSFIRIDIGLQYFQKGSKNEMYYLGRLLTRTVYSLDVISLPVCVKFKPLAKTSPYILAGGELSFVLRHKVSFTVVPEAPLENGLDRGTKKVDWGLVVGGGFEFAMARSWTPFVEIRYYAGLVDLNVPVESFADEHYPGFLKNRAVVLQVGVRFTLPGQNR